MTDFDARAVRGLLERGVRDGAFPMGAAWVQVDHRERATVYAGGATPSTLWDVASLTKPMAVVDTAMAGVQAGWLGLEDPVSLAPDVKVSVRDVLAHRSGLPGWDDLWKLMAAGGPDWKPGTPETRARVEARIQDLAGRHGAAKTPATVYSDLGYVALGWHLERLAGKSLRDLCQGFGPIDDPSQRARCAATGTCERRGRLLQGEVHDLNTWVLGGAAGHAGVFSTLSTVADWVAGLTASHGGRGGPIDGAVVREFWSLDNRQDDSTWVLGWDTPTPGSSTAGSRVSPGSVGHLGFTGTSIWIDLEAHLTVVLLTNRVALGMNEDAGIRAFRPWFHDSIRDVFGV